MNALRTARYPSKAGDVIGMDGSQGGLDCSFPQCFVFNASSGAVQLIAAPKEPALCMSASAARTLVTVQACDSANPSQQFALDAGTGSERVIKLKGAEVCVSSASSGRVAAAKCAPSAAMDQFVFGESGRFCQSGNGCLTVVTARPDSSSPVPWADAPTQAAFSAGN